MYCENQTCRRIGLTKAEVEKDQKSGLLLCLGCYSLSNPGWQPTAGTTAEIIPLPVRGNVGPKLGYAVSLDSFRGFSAQVSFGDIALEFTVPQRSLEEFLGPR